VLELRRELALSLYSRALKGARFPLFHNDPAMRSPNEQPSLYLLLLTIQQCMAQVQEALRGQQAGGAPSLPQNRPPQNRSPETATILEGLLLLIDTCLGTIRVSFESMIPADFREPGPKIKEAAFFFSSPQANAVLRLSHLIVQALAGLTTYDSALLGFNVSPIADGASALTEYCTYFLNLRQES